MKVILEAQYACAPNPVGVPNYAYQLIRSLLKRNQNNYELVFFDKDRERGNREFINKHFGGYRVPIHECNDLDYRTIINDKNAFKEKSYNEYTGVYGDVFHFMHVIFPNNIAGKTVVTIHDATPLVVPELCNTEWTESFNIAFEKIKRIKPTIITDSESSKNDIAHFSGINADKIHVIPLGFDEENCNTEYDPELLKKMGINSPYFLYLGGIYQNKNVLSIFNAFHLIAEKHPDIQLIIAGKPEPQSEYIFTQIKESPHYGSRILLPGYVTNEQKNALFSNALAFVFPSLYEGFGLPVLEAMARGCPVITSNVSSLPEVAGDAAILVNPNDTEQLAFEMERIASSDTLQVELKQKGLEQSKKFSWDKTAEMTEQVYKLILEH